MCPAADLAKEYGYTELESLFEAGGKFRFKIQPAEALASVLEEIEAQVKSWKQYSGSPADIKWLQDVKDSLSDLVKERDPNGDPEVLGSTI